jgi:uncharacterized protein with von Willebrand factor type A (vWA) domain
MKYHLNKHQSWNEAMQEWRIFEPKIFIHMVYEKVWTVRQNALKSMAIA